MTRAATASRPVTPAPPDGVAREDRLHAEAIAAIPPSDPLGALYAGAPSPYVELLSNLLDYEREHDAAEEAAFTLESRRLSWELHLQRSYGAILRANIHAGLAEGFIEAAYAGPILAWLAAEEDRLNRAWGALHVVHRRWKVRRTFLIPDDIDVRAALCARPTDRDY